MIMLYAFSLVVFYNYSPKRPRRDDGHGHDDAGPSGGGPSGVEESRYLILEFAQIDSSGHFGNGTFVHSSDRG